MNNTVVVPPEKKRSYIATLINQSFNVIMHANPDKETILSVGDQIILCSGGGSTRKLFVQQIGNFKITIQAVIECISAGHIHSGKLCVCCIEIRTFHCFCFYPAVIYDDFCGFKWPVDEAALPLVSIVLRQESIAFKSGIVQ